VASASGEPAAAYRLPPLIVPSVPLDDNPFTREVFSLKDLRGNNEALLERIVSTRMDFPLMFDPLDEFARGLFPDSSRVRFGRNFSIALRLSYANWREDSLHVLKTLKDELGAQGLDRGRTDREIRLELLVFLKNYAALHQYAENFPAVSAEARREVAGTLEETIEVCRQVLEFKALTLNGIKTLDDIAADAPAPEAEQPLKFERFVTESRDMRPRDIATILELRNPAQFEALCLERTSELVADDEAADAETLLGTIGPSDAIVLASYFARDRIQAYRKPVDQMAGLYGEQDEGDLQVGDCRAFAGLAVHYLNLVVKPRNPKLEHWHFGIERENISDFNHAYVIAAHVYRQDDRERIDLFFFDPVALASQSPGKLRTKEIRQLIDAASKDTHFFTVKRYGEDFVARKYTEPLADAPASDNATGDISFDSLLPEP
jgi:hypothetical protein